ncbi:hypothetical protein [Gimesia fumaroli]|jgi:hypothetical protein|uniref:Uncharacterized protein n=1 Tax=Gimesia fumaroli TaxID=2527976 RepID=A0A518II87_9PLAN|nr:hypothetical protein [Gimesia fumaroli]QDV52799.1 hypothetical protein Enr17x_48680 [Gimesia fumaroli]
MKPYDTSGMLENDDELESVLREYFQKEMPLELQELPEISDEEFEERFSQKIHLGNGVPVRNEHQRHGQFKLSYLITAVCACVIVGVVALTQFQPAPQAPVVNNETPTEPVPARPSELQHTPQETKPIESDALAVVDHGSTPIELTPEVDKTVQNSIDITLYNTESGPVEQRTERSWTNYTVQNPETGANVKMSMPELTIDFIPVNKSGLSLIKEESDRNGQ